MERELTRNKFINVLKHLRIQEDAKNLLDKGWVELESTPRENQLVVNHEQSTNLSRLVSSLTS